MTRKSSYQLVLLFIITGICIAGCAAYATRCQEYPREFSYSGYEKHFRLHISAISSLPGDIVLAGGYYYDDANTIHPALFISKDAGRSWDTIPFRLKGCGIERFQSIGATHVWALVSFKQEGAGVPKYLLRSIDAAKNWCILPVDFTDIDDPLSWVCDFKFYDTTHGIVTMTGSLGGNRTYMTKNSGDHWESLGGNPGNAHVEIETDYQYPGLKDQPLNTPLWNKIENYYKITALLRIKKRDKNYIVERYEYANGHQWETIAKIAGEYTIENGQLTPLY